MNYQPALPLSEDQRRQRAVLSNGQPIMEFNADRNPFADYLASADLLALQRPRTTAAAEPAFLITGQVMELLFKLATDEVSRATDQLEADDVGDALWTLRRLRGVYSLLSGTWDLLASLSPTEYAEFRDKLGEGSGVQSYMYRHLEFALGNKSAAMADMHRSDKQVHRALRRRMADISLYDAALRLLRRRGLPLPDDYAERDWSLPYQENDAVIEVWQMVYTEQNKYPDLYRLGEALVDLAHDHARWRSLHVLTVERLLGTRVGTGGTSGVKWLRRVADHRFFPELWTLRATL